jgi:hypothetical protein
MPTYSIVETTEHRVSAHCEACAKDVFLSAGARTEFIGVSERWIEIREGDEPEDAHEYRGGF